MNTNDDKQLWVRYTINGSIDMIKAVQEFIYNWKLDELRRLDEIDDINNKREGVIKKMLTDKWNKHNTDEDNV